MRYALGLIVAIFLLGVHPAVRGGEGNAPAAAAPASELKGPLADPSFFPIAVWLQSPAQAGRYKEAGINLYVALWRGPDRGPARGPARPRACR